MKSDNKPETEYVEYYFGTDLREIASTKGGPGSGHFGHRGRPGEVGGSLPEGEGKNNLSVVRWMDSPDPEIHGKAMYDEGGKFLQPQDSPLYDYYEQYNEWSNRPNYYLDYNDRLIKWFLGRIGGNVSYRAHRADDRPAGGYITDNDTGEEVYLKTGWDDFTGYYVDYIRKTKGSGILGTRVAMALKDLADYTMQDLRLISANPDFWNRFRFFTGGQERVYTPPKIPAHQTWFDKIKSKMHKTNLEKGTNDV